MDLEYTVNRKVTPKPFLHQERYVAILFTIVPRCYRFMSIVFLIYKLYFLEYFDICINIDVLSACEILSAQQYSAGLLVFRGVLLNIILCSSCTSRIYVFKQNSLMFTQ